MQEASGVKETAGGQEALRDLVGRGRVHRRFYIDPEVFRAEMSRI